MKRTYVNRLPKNEEVKNTNVRVENGELIVEVEFKDKFQPKDGDFCVDYYGNTFILCEEGNVGINHGSYALFNREDGDWLFQKNNITRAVRYATEKEKTNFLERLKKECGKRWNEETKELEDIRWRAEKGEIYFYVDNCALVTTHGETFDMIDNIRYDLCNYFRYYQSAQKVADQIKEIFKNSKAE